ncbi:MAG: polymer-forming cytoskeletal protein [Gammaproteobacteria bacterium]|nr:polymer-forming cytoskeletal protein [Gammaproteobacteria bacterium]
MFEFGKGKRPAEEQDMQQRDSTTAMRSESPAPAGAAATARPHSTGQPAVIGPSIRIEGDLQGEEDLVIEGEVHGTVNLRGNALTIGSKGQVKADVYAHSIRVEGHMEGDLYAAERAVITKTANVRGNITAPRVNLEDGARFRGSIEMDPESLQPVFGASKAANVSGAGSATSGASASSPAAPLPGANTPASRAAGTDNIAGKDKKAAN